MNWEGLAEMVQAAAALQATVREPRWRSEDRVWRTEDREWRHEDRGWRKADLSWRQEEQEFMRSQRHWRGDDLQQRTLDNARVLWNRFVERNRRDVEERAEQLKSIGNMAALVAGFAVVAFLEFSPPKPWEEFSDALTMAFGFTTALVVGLMAQAMVTSSLMHASILSSGKSYVDEEAEAEFMHQCLHFAALYEVGHKPPAPKRTFEQHWATRCEADWRWAFRMFAAGLVAFIVNLIIAAWIKFSGGNKATPGIITVTLAVSMLFMIKSIFTWASHLFDRQGAYSEALTQRVAERRAKAGGLPFDWHRVPCVDCDAPAFMPCASCAREHESLLVPAFQDAASSDSSLSSVESALPGHDRHNGKLDDSVHVSMAAESSSSSRWPPVATPSGLAALNIENGSGAAAHGAPS